MQNGERRARGRVRGKYLDMTRVVAERVVAGRPDGQHQLERGATRARDARFDLGQMRLGRRRANRVDDRIGNGERQQQMEDRGLVIVYGVR